MINKALFSLAIFIVGFTSHYYVNRWYAEEYKKAFISEICIGAYFEELEKETDRHPFETRKACAAREMGWIYHIRHIL